VAVDKQKDAKADRYIGLGSIVLGLVVAIVATVLVVQNLLFLHRTIAIPGEVMADPYVKGRRGGAYYPIIKYTTPAGRIAEFRSNIGWQSHFDVPVGSAISLYVDPDDMSAVRLGSFRSLWLTPGGAVFFSLILVLMGWLYILRSRRTLAGIAGEAA
jgi:hypothetical protein